MGTHTWQRARPHCQSCPWSQSQTGCAAQTRPQWGCCTRRDAHTEAMHSSTTYRPMHAVFLSPFAHTHLAVSWPSRRCARRRKGSKPASNTPSNRLAAGVSPVGVYTSMHTRRRTGTHSTHTMRRTESVSTQHKTHQMTTGHGQALFITTSTLTNPTQHTRTYRKGCGGRDGS